MRRNQNKAISTPTRDQSPTEAGPVPADGRRRGGGVFECEHIGYFEEFLRIQEGLPPKGLGIIVLPVDLPAGQAGRPMGYAGRRQFVVDSNLLLRRGGREVLYKASPKKPITVVTMLQRLEGRALNR